MSDPPIEPPIDPPPPVQPPTPPAQQAQVEIVSRLVLATGFFPSGSPDPGTVEIVDLDQVAWAEFQAAPPGQKYLAEDGTLTVVPPPPEPIRYAQQNPIDAQVRTTTATVLEVFRFPCAEKHLYRANLRISGVDTAPGMTSLVQEGRFVWKRETGNAILVGITVVSQIPTPLPNGWATNCFAQGTDIVFTVKGPASTVIDWLLVGEVGRFAPEGLET